MATLFNTKIKDTYQSLLKLEDNTILTTTTKNVTDGLGNASPLYMSTTRVGVGTNAPSVAFEVRSPNQTDVIRFKSQYAQYGYLWTGNTQVGLGSSSFGDGTGTHIVLNNIGAWIGAAGADMATAKLQVKGSGSTSATTSLLVQDSGGTQIFKIQDDGQVIVNKGNQQVTFAGSGGISRIQVPNEMTIGLGSSFNAMKIYFDGRVGLQNDALFINNGNVGIGTSTPSAPLEVRGLTNNSVALRIGGLNTGRDFTFNPYYATNTYGGLFSNESGNITLGASLGTDNGSGIGIILGAPSGTRTALLQVKGTGSTSATTSLLVQNSAGTNAFQIQDDLTSTFKSYGTYFTHPTFNGSIRIENTGNYTQRIAGGGGGESIVWGPGNTIVFNSGETYVTASFLGPNFWIQGNGAFCLGQQATAHASSLFDMRSTTKGFLPPRMTNAQRAAITSPAIGLMVYCTDAVEGIYVYKSTGWTFVA